jgi:pilus assembly protein Flp/PilA
MRLLASEQGQGLVEYALIFVLVILLVIVALTFFGGFVGELYSDVIVSL